MSKYVEIVPISQRPDIDGWYYVLNSNKEILPRMIEFMRGEFRNHNKILASYYLKPLDRLPLSREQAGPSVLVEALEKVIEIVKEYGDTHWKLIEPSLMAEDLIKKLQTINIPGVKI